MGNYCTNCGKLIDNDANFCVHCGTKLNNSLNINKENYMSEYEKKEAKKVLKRLTGRRSDFKDKLSKEGLTIGEGNLIKFTIKREIELGKLNKYDVEKRIDFFIKNKKYSGKKRMDKLIIFTKDGEFPTDRLKSILTKDGINIEYQNLVTQGIYKKFKNYKIKIFSDEAFEEALEQSIISYGCKLTNPDTILSNMIENKEYFKKYNLNQYEIYEIKSFILREYEKDSEIFIKSRLDHYIDLKTNKSKRTLTKITGYGYYFFSEDELNSLFNKTENIKPILENNKNTYFKFLEKLNNHGLSEDYINKICEIILDEIEKMNLKENAIDSRIKYHINQFATDISAEKVLFAITGYTNDRKELNEKFLERNKEKLVSAEDSLEICKSIFSDIENENLRKENIKSRLNEDIEKISYKNWKEFYKKAINGIKCEVSVNTGEMEHVVVTRREIKGHKVNELGATLGGGFLLGPVGALLGATTAKAANAHAKEDEIIEITAPVPKYKTIETEIICDDEKISFENVNVPYNEMSNVHISEYSPAEEMLKIDFRTFHYTIYFDDQYNEKISITLPNARETNEYDRFITSYGLYNLFRNKKYISKDLINELKENKEEVNENNMNTADELIKYGKLYENGLLTKEEFDTIKKRLLKL